MSLAGPHSPERRLAHCAALLALLLSADEASATEPFRMLSPSGDAPHPAVLLVPGCSGFIATNGVNPYDERASELQAAGYVVVFVDYIGRRSMSNCAYITKTEVGADILEAASWARAQTGVDPGRITVIGWSYGRRSPRGVGGNVAGTAYVREGCDVLS